jgi:hypothetical protein
MELQKAWRDSLRTCGWTGDLASLLQDLLFSPGVIFCRNTDDKLRFSQVYNTRYIIWGQ